MNIVYLQADSRYNNWLLQKIGDRLVIEYTLDLIKKLHSAKIVAGIFNCCENLALREILCNRGVEVVSSEIEDVNSRFIGLMEKESAEYIIRVGGDQIFLDVEKANDIIKEIMLQKKEFFYHFGLSCVLPDIVSVDCLKKHRESILHKKRYFEALDEDNTVERYRCLNSSALLYDFRVNSYVSYRVCKHVIDNKMDIYELSMKLSDRLRNKYNYLNRTGILGSWVWGNTYEDFFADEEEAINPWWVKEAADLVKSRLSKNMTVFEWGSGNSTLFMAQYAGHVVSIEHNLMWYQRMQEIIPSNVRLEFCELMYGGEYCQKIRREDEKFDIVVIDGRDRVRCVQNAVEFIKEDGIIIWDDTHREEYREGFDFLKKYGYKQLQLGGITYSHAFMHYTSIFYGESNLLGL